MNTSTSILHLIGQYVNLQPGRKAWKGNCPFHADENLSLMVAPEKNTFKCFGCGIEGGPAEFLNRIDRTVVTRKASA